jgi:hypothetical protein
LNDQVGQEITHASSAEEQKAFFVRIRPTITDNNPLSEGDESARCRAEQQQLAERARQCFRDQLALQQQQQIQNNQMAQQLDQAAIEALIDAAVAAAQQALQAQITQQAATLQQSQADLQNAQQQIALLQAAAQQPQAAGRTRRVWVTNRSYRL